MNQNLPIKILPQEMKDISLKLNYNSATDFKEVLVFNFCGKSYAIYDQYCKNPDCTCTESTIDFVEIVNSKLSETCLTVDYDFEKKVILDVNSILPTNFENELVADESFNLALKFRNSKVKLAFIENELKSTKEQLRHIISSKKIIGRNEPCVCGSGKKYKKCCG